MSSSPPKIVADDSQAIVQEMIAAYEAMTGSILSDAQPERLLIDLLAYRETLVRTAINDAARQNLVAFARPPMLDYLGELVGVTRLPAQSASALVRLTLAAPLTRTLMIPAGFRVATASGVQFHTREDVLANIGASVIDITVFAVEPGPAGNGLALGKINRPVDCLGVTILSVSNLTVTVDGADIECDEHLRERIKLAPERFSTAGSRLAYRYHAISAHPDIIDVAVDSPAPGVVRLFPLSKNGLPSAALRHAVAKACSDEKVRPLTDQVQVLPPQEITYSVRARLLVFRDAHAECVLEAARSRLVALTTQLSATLGRDIVPSQLIAALSVPGVYQVELIAPATTLDVPVYGWPHCIGIDLVLAGERDG